MFKLFDINLILFKLYSKVVLKFVLTMDQDEINISLIIGFLSVKVLFVRLVYGF